MFLKIQALLMSMCGNKGKTPPPQDPLFFEPHERPELREVPTFTRKAVHLKSNFLSVFLRQAR